MRRTMAVLVVMLLSLGPLAQAVDVGPVGTEVGPTIVEPAVPTYNIEPDARELLSNIDGFFTENLGQKGEGAGFFYCQGSPLSVAFGEGWVAYDYRPEESDEGVMFRVTFEGSSLVDPVGLSTLAHKSNYFIGNDPDKWVTGARSFKEVLYPGIYDGIDLKYRFDHGHLKYDLIVAPGADPSEIEIRYEGVEGINIDEGTGDLIIRTSLGNLIDKAPIALQPIGSSDTTVPCTYQIREGPHLTFDVPDYDQTLPLIIDPELLFSTFLGGSDADFFGSIDTDLEGNIIIVGETDSIDFPVTPGAYNKTNLGISDAFVTKLSANGTSLLFSTYLGGSTPIVVGGLTYDACHDVELDSNQDLYLTGWTYTTDFPTTADAVQADHAESVNGSRDAFITKMNSSGDKLLYSTYLGGNGSDDGNGIRVDDEGNVYVHGGTNSPDFPVVSGSYDTTHNGNFDLFITKLNLTGARLEYSTYVGGSGSEIGASGFHLDSAGCTYLGGWTNSTDLPTTPSAYMTTNQGDFDGFVVVVNASGTGIVHSTYFGGSNHERCNWMDVDSNGSVFLTGQTNSLDFPTSGGAYCSTFSGKRDAFLLKLDATLGKVEYSTFIGGSDSDKGYCLDVDDNGTVHICGQTWSDDFPTTFNAYNSSYSGKGDGFYLTFDITLNLLTYSTYFGGSHSDDFRGIIIYLERVTLAGWTYSVDYPTTPSSYDTSIDNYDIGITQFSLGPINGTPPTQPLNLKGTSGDRSVTLNWTPPMDDGGLPLGGFRVFRGTSLDNLSEHKQLPHKSSALVDHPPIMGRPYFYAVCAFNILGLGNRSAIIEIIPYGSPHEPQNLELTPGCGSVQLTWDPPQDDHGLPIIHYQVYRGETWSEQNHYAEIGNKTEYTDSGLEIGHEYFYKVRGDNAKFNGTTTQPRSAIPVGPPTEPRSPFMIVADSQLTLRWIAPSNDGGMTITGYRIFRGLVEDDLAPVQIEEGYIRKFVDANLTNGVTYIYAVQAFNDVGDSPLSSIVNGTPIGSPSVPLNLAVESGNCTVTIEWDPPESDEGALIIGYEVFRGTTSNDLVSIWQLGPGATSYIDKGLMNGQVLYYSVCARNKVGCGPKTAVIEAMPHTLPDAPRDLVAQAGDRIVTIAWLRSQYDGGMEIIHYHLYRGTSGDSLEPFRKVDLSTSRYDDEEIEMGTEYFYAVAAITAAGEGPHSIIASAIPFGPPGIPKDLVLTAGNREVHMSWSAPENDGASPIEGYVILRGTSLASMRELTQLGDVTSYLDTTVANWETYYYAIAAINKAGPGDFTEPLSATPIKPITAPGKVMTLVGDPKGAKVTLQWSLPHDDGGSSITGYVVYRGDSAGSMEVVATLGLVTTWSDEDVERGITYFYSVAALNDVGEGEPFAAYPVKVPKEKEDSPGFEAVAVAISLLIVIPIMARRRD